MNESDKDKIREGLKKQLQTLQEEIRAMQSDPLLQDKTYRAKMRKIVYLRRRMIQLGRKRDE